jgi:methionyl-tRNA formyltransferase
MKKLLAICCSDILGIPAIIKLKQQNILSAVATADKTAAQLVPIFKALGIADNEIHILTKKNLEAELKTLIMDYDPEALFTFTFSWMIPNVVLNLIPQRCINFHFGLLPKYKGADPIFWQLKNGETRSGITIHVMTGEIDAGMVILKEEMPAIPGETYGLNAQRLGALAADNVMKVVAMLNAGSLQSMILAPESPLYLKKPSHTDLLINWQKQTAAEIENLINAANPRYQGAITRIRQMQMNLLEVAPVDINNPTGQQFGPGTIIHADLMYGLIVACINNQYLKINVVFIQEGYFSGAKLFSLGFAVGEVFDPINT